MLIDDFVKILKYVLKVEIKSAESKIVNIVNSHNFSVEEIIHAIEKQLNKKAIYKEVDSSSNSGFVDNESKKRFIMSGIQSDNYIENLVKFIHVNRLIN